MDAGPQEPHNPGVLLTGQGLVFSKEESILKKSLVILCCAGLAFIVIGAYLFSSFSTEAARSEVHQRPDQVVVDRAFEVQILVNGRPLEQYYARGRNYVEAIEGAEYEVKIRNPLPLRVAVALSVDGLNTIDARHTTAWNASKWVIEPYGTISVTGWQMSSERARRFYFTSEGDSYGAKLGQTSNLGIVSAVFFRERRSYPIPVTPPPGPRPRPLYEEDSRRDRSADAASAGTQAENSAKMGRVEIAQPDDEFAATGIGRSVHNDVRWINMDLETRPAAEVMIRYEYYPALVRLGIVPRTYTPPSTLRRREGARGFEDRRFSPEP